MKKVARILVNSGRIALPKEFQSRNVVVESNSVLSRDGANHLKEYDVIVLDYQRGPPDHPERTRQMNDFLVNNHGILVYIMNRYHVENTGLTNYTPFQTFLQSELGDSSEVFSSNAKGRDVTLTHKGRTGLFGDYLSVDKMDWEIVLKKEFAPKVIPLATNIDDDIVAFSLVRYQIFFLPWLHTQNIPFWEALIEGAFGASGMGEPPPDWMTHYSIPQIHELQQEIASTESQIDVLTNKRDQLVDAKESLERVRNVLLSGTGTLLNDVVRDCLHSLGLNPTEESPGEEDTSFIQNTQHYVWEVKGLTGSAGQKDISQLKAKQSSYEEKHGVKTKGVLIVNGWRELPPEQRVSPNAIFPDQMLKYSKIWNICCMTTQQLFVAYCNHKEGTFNLEVFVNELHKTDGILKGYDDLNRYKVPSTATARPIMVEPVAQT